MKTAAWTLLLLGFALVQISHQKSTPESDSYVGAVVSFAPLDPSPTDEPQTDANAATYVSFIEKAAKQNVDIIVFPECGVTSIYIPGREALDPWATFVPSPSSNYIPCVNSTIPVMAALTAVSCAARKNGIYVVVNFSEKVICTNDSCPPDKRLYYNTQVVFDREGRIMARYRKTNLFNEKAFNVTKIPEVVTFDTDFGVTFGTFVCFDIYFKKPAMYLTRMKNVTDIVYSTAWFNEVPFLTAAQIQAGWAYAEDVNVLAAGLSSPATYNTGSGIYLGRQGVAKAIMPTRRTNEMLVIEVPKKNKGPRTRPAYSYSAIEADVPVVEEQEYHVVHDEFRRKRSTAEPAPAIQQDANFREDELQIFRENLSDYKSLRFNSSIAQTLCDGDLCCDFAVEVTNVDSSNNYRLVIHNGDRGFIEPVIAGVQICAVVLCSNDSLSSCGVHEDSETTFGSIAINVTYPNYENILVLASSVGENLLPLANWTYEERYEDKKVHISAVLGTPARNVIACGLYTRDFARDRPVKKSKSGSGMQWATLTALAIVSVFLLFLYRKGWRKPWHRNDPHASEGHGPYQHLRIR